LRLHGYLQIFPFSMQRDCSVDDGQNILRINEDERSHLGLEKHPERQAAVSRD